MQQASVCGDAIGNKISTKSVLMDTTPQYDEPPMWARNGVPAQPPYSSAIYSGMPPSYAAGGAGGGPPQLNSYTTSSNGLQQAPGANVYADAKQQQQCCPNGAVPSSVADYGRGPAPSVAYSTTAVHHYQQGANGAGGGDFGPPSGGASANPMNAVQVAAAAVAAATAVAVDPNQYQGYPPVVAASAQQQQQKQYSQVPMYGTQQQYSSVQQQQQQQPPSYGAPTRMVQPNMMSSRHQMGASYAQNMRPQQQQLDGVGPPGQMIRYATVQQQQQQAQTSCIAPRQRMMSVGQSPHYAQAAATSPMMAAGQPTGVVQQQQQFDPNVDVGSYSGAPAAVVNGPYIKYPQAGVRSSTVCYPGGANGPPMAMGPRPSNSSYSNAMSYGAVGGQQQQQQANVAYHHHQQQQQQQAPMGMTQQMSAMSGGQASSNANYAVGPYQQQQQVAGGGSGYAEVKPMVAMQQQQQSNDDEPRMSFPVKDGVILQPFRLEHNIPVSQISFVIPPDQFNILYSDPDLDVQLKCFHADDRFMCNNWPHNANIQIMVNDTQLVVRHIDRPMYVKRLCQPNKNALQIAVQQCCCSHLFMLALVSRPHVDRVLSNLVRRKLLPVEMAIEKIRRSFVASDGGPPMVDVEHLSTTVSLKCPFTMAKMSLPARCQDCRHIQCFDLKSFLMVNRERPHWQCPICARPTNVESLEIDQYVWGILTNVAKCPDVTDVTIDSTASWKANNPAPMMRPDSGQYAHCPPPAKRVKGEPDGGWNQTMQQAGRIQAERVSSNSTGQMAPGVDVKMSPQPVAKKQHPYANQTAAEQQAMARSPYQQQQQPVAADSMPQQMLKYGPPTPATPLANPPSVGGCGNGGGGPRSVGNPPSVEAVNNNPMLHGPAAQTGNLQLSVDGNPTGSAPYTPASVGSSGSQQGSLSVNAASNEPCNPELNDLAFDAADLLPSDGASDNLGNFFTDSTMPDPGEFIQYFESSNFGDFGLTNGDKVVDAIRCVNNNKEDAAGQQQPSKQATVASMTSSDMDDILSLFES